ncbi:MAG: beta-galactosidase [Chthonomonadales bacterium]|nr:beta-galactosidase [Chthonomonadales bacterium]
MRAIAHLSVILIALLDARAGAQPRLIAGFEGPSGLALARANNVRLLPVAAGATEGKRALRVDFGDAEWPNVTLAGTTPWDWSGYDGLALDLRNPGRAHVEFGVRVDDDPRADGARYCRQAGSGLAPGASATFLLPLGPGPMEHGMRGMPMAAPGMRVLGVSSGGPLNLSHIVAFQVFAHRPAAGTALVIDNVRLVRASASLEGIVDRFGQYTGAEWPGKARSETDLKLRADAEERALRAAPALKGRDRFGGWRDGPRMPATGYFRTEKVNGRWWLVTPDGTLFFSLGMDCVGAWNPTFVTGREPMFTWLPGKDEPLGRYYSEVSNVHSGPIQSGTAYNFLSANLDRKLGPEWERAWLDLAVRRLRSWGFNTVGNWSDARLYRNGRIPYVATTGISGPFARVASGQDYWGKMPDPFDPRFAEAAAAAAGAIARQVAGDPWCVGTFVDNELSWGGGDSDAGRYGLALGALALEAAASPAKRAFLTRLRERYPSVERLNAAWGASFPDWEALAGPLTPPASHTDALRGDLRAFTLEYARQYFRTVRDALHAVDPDHLYLGCRFAGYTPEAVQAAAELSDVVSFNIYAPRVDAARYGFLTALDRPCIIGEFHVGALDRGMFHTGLVAAPNQRARAAIYQGYVRSVLDNPAFVGCHWFQYVDEPLTGRYFDGENYNIGFVTVVDSPYPELVTAARAVHVEAYRRRFAGPSEGTPASSPARP